MERLTRVMVRRRWIVIFVWLVVLIFSMMAASQLNKLLTNRFVLPNTDTERTERILEDHFGQRPTGTFMIVFKAKNGNSVTPEMVAEARLASIRAAKELKTGKLASVRPVSDAVINAVVVSKLEPADAKQYTAKMRAAAGSIPGANLYVSGQSAIEHDLDPVFANDLQIGELFIAVPVALLILVFVFGTLAFLIPFMFAAASIFPTLAIIWIFAQQMQLATYLTNLVMLIGLGIAIDYSLLIVYRYRQELEKNGGSREEALVRTMQTAGRTVVFSGTAVAIGLALMLAMPLPFMRGFGLGGLLIPLVSVVCALTLLPVLLYFLEARLDRVRLIPKSIIKRRGDEEHNFWHRFALVIMRRPLLFASMAVVVLLTLAIPAFSLEVGSGSNKGIPQNLSSVRGMNILSNAIGEGGLNPTAIAIDTKKANGATSPAVAASVDKLLDGLRDDPQVTRVDVDGSRQHLDPTKRYINITVSGKEEFGAQESKQFVNRLRDSIIPNANFPQGVSVYAGGGPPSTIDFIDLAYGSFPWLILAVLIFTYCLLLRAFRSLLIPLKAIILNLLSIGAAYGLMVVAFKWGVGDPIGITTAPQIEGWIPIFIFAMIFGLSMDYEVFLVSRMREEWDKGRTNEEAVAEGLAKTGRIITAAGLVMFAAFMGFVAGSIVGLQQFGFGLGMAILIDITIVRAVLVPSAMKLFGRWNWWLPEGIAKIFRVAPSPLEHRKEPRKRESELAAVE